MTTVFATDGAMSHLAVLGIPKDPAPAELARIRRGEALAAADVMGVDRGDVVFLDFPDTRLADHLPAFEERVTQLLSDLGDIDVVYLPHETRELNADHRLTGEVVGRVLNRLGRCPALRRFVIWDEQTETEFQFVNRADTDARPQQDEPRTAVDISDYLDVKNKALDQHRTQVTLFSPAQTRTVVPEAFAERVRTTTIEEFWTHGR